MPSILRERHLPRRLSCDASDAMQAVAESAGLPVASGRRRAIERGLPLERETLRCERRRREQHVSGRKREGGAA